MAEVTFGLSLYTGQQQTPRRAYFSDVGLIAGAAEAAGFDTFWVSEHHGFDDGYLPSPLAALAAASQHTSSITLATGVALAPLDHPLRLAEDAVVVDHLSDGRLLLGLGGGYVPREFSNLGVPMSQRGRRLQETVEILRRAWTGQPFSYDGRVWSLDGARVTPAARRDSGIPIWLGGYADSALERAAALGDGHLVGRGAPELLARADKVLTAARRADDPSFTFGMMLAVAGDDPAAGGSSARASFTRQQMLYEGVQEGTDVYGDRRRDGPGTGLELGDIDAYLQLTGDTDELVRRIVGFAGQFGHWAKLHLSMRALFPEEDIGMVLRRIDYLGRTVLSEARAVLSTTASSGRRQGGHHE